MEKWKDIQGYEGLYHISSVGKVKSFVKSPFYPKNETGVFLKHSTTKKGYLRYDICKNALKVGYSAHRLVAIAFIPNPNNLPEVNHINGIKTDNRVENLEWCTCQQNIQAAFDTGLKNVNGEKHPRSLFTNHQIQGIRKTINMGFMNIKQMSNYYNVSYDTMWKAVKKNYQKI